MNGGRHVCFTLICVNLSASVLMAFPMMDLTFVYQGRLFDEGNPADGEYDLEFTLFDGADPNEAVQITLVQPFDEFVISNGYVTVPIDFHPFDHHPHHVEEEEIFNGSDRWLRIGIRPGSLSDPNEYTYLEPLRKLTAVPYAHMARRVEPPETLKAELDEPVLEVINEGTGPAVKVGGDMYLCQPNAAGTDENTIEFEGNGTLDFVQDAGVIVGHNRQMTISNNDTVNIGVNSTTVIGSSRNTTVSTDDQTIVGGTSTLTSNLDLNRNAGRDMNLTANGHIRTEFENDGYVEYGTDADISIGGNRTTIISGTDGVTVTSNKSETVGGSRSIVVGTHETKIVNNTSNLTASDDVKRTAGRDVALAAGRDIQLSGSVRITAADPNLAVFVDGGINLQPKEGLPPVNSQHGTLFYRNGQLYFRDQDELFAISTVNPVSIPVTFSVKRDAVFDWPVNGTVQVIDFSSGSTVWDNTGSGFNQPANRFETPVDGLYSFTGVVQFRNLTAGDQIYAEFQAGSKYYRGDHKYASGSTESVQMRITVPLKTGDVVRLRAYVSATSPPAQVYGNASTSYAFTYFNGARVN